MSHAALAPSDSNRWLNCPGSVSMQKAFPETGPSEASEDGDATHWIAAEVLQGRGPDPFVGKTAPNGVIITEEMEESAKVYVEHVNSVVSNLGTVGVVVEQFTDIPRIHAECGGTPDTWWYDEANAILHIFDLKYGWGIVEPDENTQLICYAIGVMDSIVGLVDQDTRVWLHIVQPRAPHRFGPCRVWEAMCSDLRGWANQLAAAGIEALGKDPRCISGEHCKNCSAAHVCLANQKAAYNAVDLVDSAEGYQLDNDAAVSEYFVLKRAEAAIKNRLSAREGNLIAKVQSGEHTPGIVLERGQGRAAWSKPIEEVFALGDALKKDLRAPLTAITPAKAKAKGIPVEIVSAYSSTGVTGLKLISADKSFASQAFKKG